MVVDATISMVVDLCYRGRMTMTAPTEQGTCCTPIARDHLSASQAEGLARSLKALADPARLRLLSIVAASDAQEACVCDLTEPLDIGQSTVSHHLKVLTDAGFLTRSKRGTWAYYKLVPGALDAVSRTLISG